MEIPPFDVVAWNGKPLNTAAFHADGKPLDLEKAAAQAGFVFSGLNARERTKCSPSEESVHGGYRCLWEKMEFLLQGKLGQLGMDLSQGIENFCSIWATETPKKPL